MIDYELMILKYFNNYFIAIVILFVYGYINFKHKNKRLDYVFAIILAAVISELLKYFINIPRPSPLRPDIVFEGSGFPSTHSALASVVLFFYIFVLKKHYRLLTFVITLSSLVVFILRYLSHAHSIVDILAGIIIGVLVSLVFMFYDISGRRTL